MRLALPSFDAFVDCGRPFGEAVRSRPERVRARNRPLPPDSQQQGSSSDRVYFVEKSVRKAGLGENEIDSRFPGPRGKAGIVNPPGKRDHPAFSRSLI